MRIPVSQNTFNYGGNIYPYLHYKKSFPRQTVYDFWRSHNWHNNGVTGNQYVTLYLVWHPPNVDLCLQ